MARFVQKIENDDIQKRIQRHKRQKLLIITGAVVVLAIVCVCLVHAYLNRNFNSYDVIKAIEREDAGSVQYLPYNDKVLKVSRDGASAIDSSGNILFNGSYEMRNPLVDICENYIAVADRGGYDIYVFDGEDSGKKVTVTLPILQVQVARQGVVAVLMEDKDSNVIQLYRTDDSVDTMLVDNRTYVENNGFPVSFALSDDGKKMVTCYIRVKNGVLQNQVTFYNFSEVGQNVVNNMVGMKDYGSTIVADVAFIGNDTVCVYTESGFEVFSMTEKNKELFSEEFEKDIVSVFHNESYIGVVLENLTEESKYQVEVYSAGGDHVLSKSIDYTYDTVRRAEKEILFYSQNEGHILKLNGVEKLSLQFSVNVTELLPLNNYNKYYLVEDNQIDIIKLTEE